MTGLLYGLLYGLHVLMGVAASWRITELFTQDRATERFRKWANTYLFSCPRCMSFWSGVWVTLVLVAGLRWPLVLWLNWPFAFSWLYISHVDYVVGKRMATRGRELKITIAPSGQWQLHSELTAQETERIIGTLARQFQTAPRPPASVA